MRLALALALQILAGPEPQLGSLAGTVRDADRGVALPGALVLLVELSRTAVSDPEGRYRFEDVPAGRLRLSVRRVGYLSRAVDVLIPANGRIELNLVLDAEPYQLAPIEVRQPIIAAGAAIGGAGPTLARRIVRAAALRYHPLAAEPDPLQALRGQGIALDPEMPQGLHLDGGSSDQTSYLLDGIPSFNPYHAAGLFGAWNPDALERIEVASSLAEPGSPAALSGTIRAITRTPGDRIRSAGALSTVQARLTLDGPLSHSTGVLLSVRRSFPALFAPVEASYLRGGGQDILAKLETALFGGRVRGLLWSNDNELGAASVPPSEGSGGALTRHELEWRGRSLGLQWERTGSTLSARVSVWSALGDAEVAWRPSQGGLDLAARRLDEGVTAEFQQRGRRSATALGLSLERSAIDYRVDAAAGQDWSSRSRHPIASAFGEHRVKIGGGLTLAAGGSVLGALGRVRLAPQGEVLWSPGAGFAASFIQARRFQFAQSLRNPESIVGGVFPADLYLGAGSPGVPVARSDQSTLTAMVRPAGELRIDLRVYRKELAGIVLVALAEPGPFATSPPVAGSGTSTGLSLAVAWRAPGVDLSGSYDRQAVRYAEDRRTFVPSHATSHAAEGGIVLRPSSSWSFRLGALAHFGRRVTGSVGGVEWEACNLLDRGCEFAGTPALASEPLGSRALPTYLRIDLGVRKEWSFRVGAGRTTLAAFGTLSNLLGRVNLHSYLVDPATGGISGIEMRPRAPLVVGLDWRP